jgi:RHS repeat-associated protein
MSCALRWVAAILLAGLAASAWARPEALLSAPAAGTRYIAPATIKLKAGATVDAGRTVARVDFLANGELIGTSTGTPYTFSWSNVPQGNYTFRARVTDSRGQQDNSPDVVVRVRKNEAPRVRLSASAPHRYLAPASIALSAEVTDRDDPIAKVEFFNGATLLATLTRAPYAFAWTAVPAGTYDLTARATDSLGATGKSNVLRTRVRDNAAPHVRITVPSNNASFAAPATIAVAIRANDPDHNINRVELLANGALISSFSAPPYDFKWAKVAAGTYVLTARATDDLGLTTTSQAVTVKVTGASNQPPTVSIKSPASGAVFNAPATVTLSATAADSDGTVAKVDFFQGATPIGTATSAPYSASVANLAAGSYSFTAVATDSSGAVTTSAAVAITVSAVQAKMYYVHTDHLNTPRLITNQAQEAVWRWDQAEPFGTYPAKENPSGLGVFEFNKRFDGQYFDKETGLHYNMARDYDPQTGRYVQSDPIGLVGGFNTYLYGNANPLPAE